MKQKKIGDILYVYSTTAYEITEDTDATVIKIQEECIPAFAALNESLISKFEPINYKLFCVVKPEWADYMNDYTVTIDTITGGTVTASPNSGDEGEEITLTQEASTGYEFVSWDVEDEDHTAITVTDNKFLMPASNVTVHAYFDKSYFIITVDDNIQNGSLSTIVNQAQLGDTVTITATPASGYKLDTLTVMCGSLEITVVDNQFTMPAGDVTITGTFVQDINPYSLEYFTIESETDNNSITINQADTNSFSVSTDGQNWEASSVSDGVNTITKSLDYGDKLLIKSNNGVFWTNTSECGIIYTLATTGQFKVYGNTMSLIYGDNFINKTSFPENTSSNLSALFVDCTGLTDASNLILPATTLAQGCYRSMFSGCTALTTVPTLSATTLADYCYSYMFNGCTSLTTAPELPATTLAKGCYDSMFYSCTSLTTAPTLSATTLVESCYSGMFGGCTSLTIAPALPATTLADYCYSYMFNGCTSLTTAPTILPATTLTENCYDSMFYSCTSLTTAPVLPATTLVQSCYSDMFNGCTSLRSITMLATTLGNLSTNNALNFIVMHTYAPKIPYEQKNGKMYVSSSLSDLQKSDISDILKANGQNDYWTVEDYVSAS